MDNLTGQHLKAWNNLFPNLVMLYRSKGITGHFRIHFALISSPPPKTFIEHLIYTMYHTMDWCDIL